MSTFNRRQYLAEAIRSVKKQTYTDWELVLVNDGGEDVQSVVSSFFDKRIRLISLPENRGKSYAVNTAFGESRGRYIAYLDDDDAWLPNHLQTHVDVLDQEPSVMLCHSNTHKVTLEMDDGSVREVGREQLYARPVSFSDLIARNEITWLSVVHRRECFDAVGGMDERLDALVDFDLWRRIAARFSFRHIPVHTGDYYFRFEKGGSHAQITGRMALDPAGYLHNHVLLSRKRFSKLLEHEHEEALRRSRRDAAVSFLIARGRSFCNAGRVERARVSLRLAIAVDSGAGALRELGRLELEQGRSAEALTCFERCLSIAPCLADHFYAAKACLALRKPHRALQFMEPLDRGDLSGEAKKLMHEYRVEAHRILSSLQPEAD